MIAPGLGDLTADTLLRRVRLVPIRTPVPTRHPCDVRIRGGRVVEVAPALRPDSREDVLDADGRWAIPGLWDQHVHLGQWALNQVRLDLSGAHCAEDATRVVADHVAQLPEDNTSTVLGFGHRLGIWPRRPTVAELDAASGDHPVVLVSGDAHNAWMNSSAARLLGVPAPVGPVEEDAWFAVFPRMRDLPDAPGAGDAGYREVLDDAAAMGLVGIVDFEFGQGHADWIGRLARGLDQVRVRTAVYADRLDEVIAHGLKTDAPLPGGRGLLHMGPLKLFADGSLNTGTAHCWEPYACGDGPTRGRPTYTGEELAGLVNRAWAHGLESAVHVIGDAAATSAVHAFETTGAGGSLEHLQLVAWEDVPRIAALGVRASVQPAHLLDDRKVTDQCWPDRAGRCFVLASMWRAGVRLALGSDAPVAPLDPWLAMAAAVHRTADDQPPWNAAESLTAHQALAASLDGQDTIGPGSPGDLVLLDDDPLRPAGDAAATAAHLRGLGARGVAATFVAGRATHLVL